MKKTFAIALLLCSLLILFTSCGLGDNPGGTSDGGSQSNVRKETWNQYLATECSIHSFGNDTDENFAKVKAKVEALLSEYHVLYDIYFEYSGINNLKTVNDNAGVSPVAVDGRIIDLLKFGIEMHGLTDGETNIMMGSVLKLWHKARVGDKEGNHTLPTAEELMFAEMHTDIAALVINEDEGTVFITDPEASIDVGAIAKGFASERIAEAITSDKSLNANGYALDFGGNVRVIGTKGDGNNFKIGITNPDKSSNDPFVATVSVADTSIVTSGDYERFFTVDGTNYHHIIDKDTLQPSKYFHSVTVVTKDSALADALSTALFSMHINDGYKLVEDMDGVEALWIGTNGTTVKSTGFPEVTK